jgi:hypothetical protein
MFYSPLEWCPRCKLWVALDQTFAQCAQEHNCSREQCPLVLFLKPQADTFRRSPSSATTPSPSN